MHFSFFPNPNEEERKAYAYYWRHKLAENKRVEFPTSLIYDFVDKTHDFSFAYMKEALYVARA